MRIAHVITRMIVGGAQENTLLCCRDLMRLHGEEVLLVTGPSLGPEGDLLERVAQERIPYEIVPSLRRPIHPWRDWRAYSRIRQILRAFEPDVVHTHSAKGGILGRKVAHALRVPAIVHTVHGAPFHPYQRRAARTFSRWCEWHAARRCHMLVSVADAMTDLLVGARVAPREKFVTVESGMEVEPFLAAAEHRDLARRRLGYDDQHVVVGKIARLFHLKGHEYLIAAARQIAEHHPHVRFLLVGDGILQERLANQIRKARLDEYFQFTGLVPPEQVPAMISAMDLVVHTSLREGLARALPQALLAGKPVVSFDIDGAREVVQDGETGFLVPPCDVDALASAVDRLVADEPLRRRLGDCGRSRCADRFRHERMTSRLRKIYQRVLAEGA
jgi:glycosyltransferase involved in cell wall biosynthesis